VVHGELLWFWRLLGRLLQIGEKDFEVVTAVLIIGLPMSRGFVCAFSHLAYYVNYWARNGFHIKNARII